MIIEVSTDFPLYNIQSGRTRRGQSRYLERHTEHQGTFFDDPEDTRVQLAQREILLQMIQDKGLDKDLEEKHQQTPIVLTKDGFIVDGNRRITALREQKVGYVTAVVLPEDADADEIYETELELQMARDTKSEYNWIDELLHIQYGIQKLDEKAANIAKRMRKSPEDLTFDLELLAYIDQYLGWRGTPGQYHKVPDNSKQPFKDVALGMKGQAVKSLTKTAKEAVKDACFGAVDNNSGYEAIRDIIKYMSKQPEVVVERLKEKGVDTSASPPSGAKQKGKSDDPMERLAAADVSSTTKSHVALAAAFEKPSTAKVAIGPLITVIEELAEEESEAKRQTNPLRALEKAEAILSKVKVDSKMSDTRAPQILSKINEHVERLARVISGAKQRK